ncbi:hypothetical protein LCGC14_0586110 [marine sediment metagenome]|uniref:Uncharacterized protein n=1 Tax=marine sediment metagenome TaxID=412755 RepID=A0A0F9RET6_9ZZZZ
MSNMSEPIWGFRGATYVQVGILCFVIGALFGMTT